MTRPFEIARIPWDVTHDEFNSEYFLPEQPVILQGVGPRIKNADDLSIDSIRERIVERGLATENTSWFEGPAPMLDPLASTPEVVTRSLEGAQLRKNHCRLWLNGPGNLTPSHYDGNLLFVFNLQLKGTKEWRIVSPHTPLTNYPFSRVALTDKGGTSRPTGRGIQFAEFTLNEGEMVFVPPLWHHSVKATGDANVNVNWVGTRKSGHVQSKTLTREKELLKWSLLHRKLIGNYNLPNLALGGGIKNYVENYGGVGEAFLREMTKGVGYHRAVTRIFRETLQLPAVLKDLKWLKSQLKKKPLDSVKPAPGRKPVAQTG
ncbi:MAG: cupin-like domain-containing protein [Verrucomicrobiota bacterium]